MPHDSVIAIFDGLAVPIMFAFGLLVKYFPPLAKIPNAVIGWVNLVGYMATKLAGGNQAHAGEIVLHAGFFGNIAPDLMGVVIGGFTNCVWARQLYEGFGRSLLEQKLGWKKAV